MDTTTILTETFPGVFEGEMHTLTRTSNGTWVLKKNNGEFVDSFYSLELMAITHNLILA